MSSVDGSPKDADAATIRVSSSFDLSESDREDDMDDHPGDYSTRMEERMDDEEEENKGPPGFDESDEEEGFMYTGVDVGDTPTSSGYRDQLKDVLGETDSEDETQEVEMSLIVEDVDHDDMVRIANYRFCGFVLTTARHIGPRQ